MKKMSEDEAQQLNADKKVNFRLRLSPRDRVDLYRNLRAIEEAIKVVKKYIGDLPVDCSQK